MSLDVDMGIFSFMSRMSLHICLESSPYMDRRVYVSELLVARGAWPGLLFCEVCLYVMRSRQFLFG